MRAGARLFVAGHDPERGGRLVYVGRVGQSVSARDARAALRLAAGNALAAARDAVGPLAGWRCVLLTGFVASATPDGLDPRLLAGALRLLRATLPAGDPPVVALRAAQSLAGGMPVEVELVLEARPRGGGGPRSLRSRSLGRRRAGSGGARAPRRSAARTS